MMIVDTIVNTIFVSVYFYVISKQWLWYFYCAMALLTIPAPFLAFYLPDSPKLFYEQQKYDSSRKIIQRIASVNKSNMNPNYKFNAEIAKEKQAH